MNNELKVSVPNSTVFAGQYGLLVEDNNAYFKVKWPENKIGTYSKPNNTYELIKETT